MTIRFVLLVNKQGQTRLAQYYEYLTIDERRALEGEIVRKCLARADNQVLHTVSPFLALHLHCNLISCLFSFHHLGVMAKQALEQIYLLNVVHAIFFVSMELQIMRISGGSLISML